MNYQDYSSATKFKNENHCIYAYNRQKKAGKGKMKLKLTDSKVLSESINIISDLVTEVKAKVNKEGLSIIAIDPANVALVTLNLPHSAFSMFELENEEVLGLNLGDLKQVLKRVSSGSSLTIEKEDNLLKFGVEGTKRHFKLALINVEQEEKKIPELEFSSKIEINSDILATAIEDASIVADACTFSALKDSFTIEAQGALNSTKTEFSSEQAKIETKDAKSKYSIEYLQKFMKAGRISDRAVIQFSSDYPARLDFKGDAEMIFILAPRVEED